MAVSLRIVIGLTTAFIVLVVASVTLAITYTVSVNAVRDTGERLSEAISSTVSHEVRSFMARGEDDVLALKNLTRVPGVTLPPDHPEFATGEGWALPWRHIARSMGMRVNYTYSSISLIFMDGSLIASLDHQDARGWYIDGAQSARRLPNGTEYRTITQTEFHTVTKQLWDNAAQGGPPPRVVHDMNSTRTALQPLQFMGFRDTCIYFPPSIDTNDVRPRLILYGICSMYNYSNVLLGTINIGVFLDELPRFLQGTSKTPNTHLMLVDSYRMLLGSTYPATALEYGRTGELRQGQNCVASSDGWVGCRAFARDYPYPPMQAVVAAEPTFVRAEGTNIRFGKLAGENYYYISQRIPIRMESYTINLVTFMPEKDVLGNIVAGRNLAIGITVAVFIVAVIVEFVFIGVLLAPVDDVARRMYFTSQLTSAAEQQKIADERATARTADDFDDINRDTPDDEPLKASSLAEVRALQSAYTTMDTAIKSFTKYVPRDVVKELMSANQMCEIQMRPMRCSMLFTDIASFTSICERVPPPILSGLVQLYFERSSRIVMGHGGVIDKFIGDCIMAVWGAPVPIDHHEIRAAICGHMLVYETQQDPLRSRFADAGENLSIRVGVASGEVLAGNMGSDARMNYTVIGDDVNLASRLEGLNKQWGTSVMVSEETAEEIAEFVHMRYVISIAVVGKEQPVKVYEVLGANPDANTEALGKVTSEASENVSLSAAKNNVALQEMAERYGNTDNSRTDMVLTTGKLLRRALRKVTVAPEEVAFAQAYTAAIAHWNRGDFGACISALQALASTPGLPTDCAQRVCVRKVLAAAEENLKHPPAGQWTGVWTAVEK